MAGINEHALISFTSDCCLYKWDTLLTLLTIDKQSYGLVWFGLCMV